MIISIQNIPDITDYMEYTMLMSISAELTLVIVFKTLFRDDDVLMDIYLNEISEDTLIISGRKLTADSIIILPKPDLGFNFWLHCVDQDGVEEPLKKYNAHKFYLQFTSYEGEIWESDKENI